MRGHSIQTVVLLIALISSCTSHPPFHAAGFSSNYEAALTNRDLQFFDRLFSKKYWVGNQYRNRNEALSALADIFNAYDELQANFTIHSIRFLPGGHSFIMQASLNLRGRRAGANEWSSINEVSGSAVYVFEDDQWRLYKTVEKSLDVPF